MVTLEDRFWSHVQKGPGCWEWTANRKNTGYGRVWADGKKESAHRVSWRITYGEIPCGMWVLHRCDNPSCVRPDHLFLGTNRDNQIDSAMKGRHRESRKTHCIHGHEYTKENTYRYGSGHRQCRVCRALKDAARHKAGRIRNRSRLGAGRG